MILLDTHAWIWWVANPDQISAPARQRIETVIREDSVCISSMSCWELSLLVKKGRLDLTLSPEEWIAKSEELPFFRFIPIDNRIAIRSNDLPGDLHDDPADRVIIATALTLGVPLITKDQKIRDYPHVETLW